MSQFCPTHTGDYIINIMWSGEHIPGSPFSLTVTDREEEGVAVGGVMNECCSVYMVMKIFKYRGDFLLL